MFKNIGKKIKHLAEIYFALGIVVTVLTALYWWKINEFDLELYFIPALILIVGCIYFWISSLFIYGFGELIDKTCDIERNTRKK